MFRLLLYWRPSLLRLSLGALLIFVSALVGGLLACQVPTFWIVPAAAALAVLPFLRYVMPFYRFARATWRLRTVAGERVVLRYAAELDGRSEVEHCLKHGNEALTAFSDQFGYALRRRLVIFLFPTPMNASRIFKSPYGGFALIGGDAIGVCADGMPGARLDEVILHEVAHLYSAGLGDLQPDLKGEGLATWLMGSVDGKPIDFHALVALLSGRYLFLTWLLVPAWFANSRPDSYYLAGSFTGHLLARFGWARYREFFKRARSKGFETTFAQIFGLSLFAAERQWRDALLERKHTLEPELSRFVAQRSVEAAYEAGHAYRFLQDVEALSHAGQADGKMLTYAAAMHMYLGHYNAAATALQQALASNDVWIRAARGACWLRLGNVYDLLAQRERAIQGYQQALAEPDDWYGALNSTHALARHYLKRPFTESEILAELRPRTNNARRWRLRRR